MSRLESEISKAQCFRPGRVDFRSCLLLLPQTLISFLLFASGIPLIASHTDFHPYPTYLFQHLYSNLSRSMNGVLFRICYSVLNWGRSGMKILEHQFENSI